MFKKILILLFTGGLILSLGISASGEVIPTSVWTDFYGSASHYNGNPIPVGSVIDAYDPDGVHCGTFTVHTEGHYGFMPVYGNDTYGDGAEIGENITLYVNGRMAVIEGPDAPVYNGMGGVQHVNLSASAAVSMEIIDWAGINWAFPGDIARIGVMVRNTGEGLDFYTVSASTEHSWLIEPMPGFVYALPGQEVTVYFDVLVPVAIFYEMIEEIDYRVQSGVDPTVYLDERTYLNVGIPTDVNDDDALLPGQFHLGQNYPNPFNPNTTFSFNLPSKADVEIEIFDILGKSLEKTNLGTLEAGNHNYDFNGTSFSSGVYFYCLRAGDFSDIKKMVLMK